MERADEPMPIPVLPADPSLGGDGGVPVPGIVDPPEVSSVAVAELPVEPTVAEPPQPPVEEKYTTTLLPPTTSRGRVEGFIIFVGAIFFLRAIAVEPFGVPTGSMAPTLTGNHRCVQCPRCDYPIRVGDPSSPQTTNATVNCPNCGKTGIELDDAPETAGDRLLVDKNVFSLRRPRRWEVAVFRCPSDLTKPYVKRVLGLPGESIQVHDGDIYINEKIARKSFADVREARIPIFDMNYPPRPLGWQHRWLAEPKPLIEGPAVVSPWLLVDGKEMRVNGTTLADVTGWASYRHCRFDDRTGDDREDVIRDSFAYNGLQIEEQMVPVHDFSIEFEVEIQGGDGSLSCRAWDGLDQVIARYPIGNSSEEAILQREGSGKVRGAAKKPLQAGKKYLIEMSFCDRRVLFALDGREIFQAYDLPPPQARAEVMSPFALGIQGASLIVRDLRIYRDLYYRSSGRNAVAEPYQLGADEYFMMGDNSANSADARNWTIPGVPERNFLGKPFLLHQPSRISKGSIGRNFIDWSRIRWLR